MDYNSTFRKYLTNIQLYIIVTLIIYNCNTEIVVNPSFLKILLKRSIVRYIMIDLLCFSLKKKGENNMRISNCKLSYKIIDKIMLSKLHIIKDGQTIEINNITSNELDLLLYLSLRQDPWGKVVGIYYKDVILELGFNSKQSFYNALYGLEEKGYIRINYDRKDEYWECIILDNIFLDNNDDKKGYLNTNRDFLHTKEFRNLSLHEKKICLKLVINYNTHCCEKHGLSVYPGTIASWINVKSIALIYRYIENISSFFPSIIKKGKLGNMIHFVKENYIPFVSTTPDKKHHLVHKLKYFCSSYKVAYTMRDLKDLIVLISQYAKKGHGRLFGTICHVLLSMRSIEPALINSLLST